MNHPLNFYLPCDDADSEYVENESFVPNSQENLVKLIENEAENGGQDGGEKLEVEDGGEGDGFDLGDDDGEGESNMHSEVYSYETPMYLYGPDYYKGRMRRRKGRHARPTAAYNPLVMTRNDELPEYFQDVDDLVAPDTFDGYEGVNLRDLEDDADSIRGEDPFARKNMTVDLFTPLRRM